LKTSSRKPENVIKFGASQVGKIYGRAAKEHTNSLKHVTRTTWCCQPRRRPGYNRLVVRLRGSGHIRRVAGQREAAGWQAVPFVISCTANEAGLCSQAGPFSRQFCRENFRGDETLGAG